MVSGRATYLTFICSALPPNPRSIKFGSDDELDLAERQRIAALFAGMKNKPKLIHAAPDRNAQQTARAISESVEIISELADLDYGKWRGAALTNIAKSDPEALSNWMSDPSQAPHGGESLVDFIKRINTWLDGKLTWGGAHTLVASQSSIRAATVAILGAPAASFWKLDIASISSTSFSSNAQRWSIRSIAVPCVQVIETAPAIHS